VASSKKEFPPHHFRALFSGAHKLAAPGKEGYILVIHKGLRQVYQRREKRVGGERACRTGEGMSRKQRATWLSGPPLMYGRLNNIGKNQKSAERNPGSLPGFNS